MKTKKIDIDMKITDLLFEFPELGTVLTYEYGIPCINCIIADFDTLREGALIHGIEEKDFKEMITHLESIVNTSD